MEQPTTRIRDAARKRPRLVIFDDDSVLLQRFTAQYEALGYDAIPVLVADGNNDTLMENGRIVQGESSLLTDADAERYTPTKRTVATELALARHKTHANPTKARFGTDLGIYEAMQDFTYGVQSKDELRTLLTTLKPDAVLSDMQMRRPHDPDATAEQQMQDPDTILGNHVMAIAAELLPNAPRVIHTGQYTVDSHMRESWSEAALANQQMRYRTLCAAEDTKARAQGYRIFAKDEPGEATTATAVNDYFQAHLGRCSGRGAA